MDRHNPYEEMEQQGRRRRRAEEPGAPFLLRFLSWLGVILMCFVMGYLGSSWLMEALNKKLLLKPQDRVENRADLAALEEAQSQMEEESAGVQQVSLTLYYVKEGALAAVKRNFIARSAAEDNIGDAVNAVLALSGAGDVQPLHVFRDAETAFLDLPSPFAGMISSMEQRQALLLLTGLVRTLRENFSPIVQVRFLIGSKLPTKGGNVDLSVPWRMPS